LSFWISQINDQTKHYSLGYYHALNTTAGYDLALSESIRRYVLSNGTTSSSVSFDYTVPTGLTQLQYPNMCVLVFFGDLTLETHCPKHPDFVILDGRVENQSSLNQSQIRKKLREGSIFKGIAYEKVFSPGYSEVYQRSEGRR
jgi:hypothetical protein